MLLVGDLPFICFVAEHGSTSVRIGHLWLTDCKKTNDPLARPSIHSVSQTIPLPITRDRSGLSMIRDTWLGIIDAASTSRHEVVGGKGPTLAILSFPSSASFDPLLRAEQGQELASSSI